MVFNGILNIFQLYRLNVRDLTNIQYIYGQKSLPQKYWYLAGMYVVWYSKHSDPVSKIQDGHHSKTF
jgi:hypothetical protein